MLQVNAIKALLLASIIIFNKYAFAENLKNPDGSDSGVRVSVVHASFFRKPAQTVLIGHGSAGVQANHQYWANIFRGLNYNAVIIDHYTLRGIAIHTGQVAISTIDRARDFSSVVSWVQKQKWHTGKMAIVGYSQGGSGLMTFIDFQVMNQLQLLPIGDDPVVASIAFYPGCFIQSPPKKPRMPILMLLAEKDNLAIPADCAPVEDEAYKVRIIPDATHSFDEDLRPSTNRIFTHRYSKQAVDQARIEVSEFLTLHLK
jgi:dienelactone hydrolase